MNHLGTFSVSISSIVLDIPSRVILNKEYKRDISQLKFEQKSNTFKLSEEKVRKFIEIEKKKFTVDLLKQGSIYSVLNGRHRIVATILSGNTEIDANVYE